MARGQNASFKVTDAEDGANRCDYVVIDVDDPRLGALELSQSLSRLTQYTRSTALRSLFLAFVMLSLSGMLLWMLVGNLIRRPLAQILDKIQSSFQGIHVDHG